MGPLFHHLGILKGTVLESSNRQDQHNPEGTQMDNRPEILYLK